MGEPGERVSEFYRNVCGEEAGERWEAHSVLERSWTSTCECGKEAGLLRAGDVI